MNGSTARSLILATTLAAGSIPASAQAEATASARAEFWTWPTEYQELDDEQLARIGISARLVSWSESEVMQGNGAVSAYYGLGPDGGGFLEASADARRDGYALGEYTLRIALDVTNGTGVDLPFLVIRSEFSAFAPDAGDGARVDRSSLEYALFSSSLFGAAREHGDDGLGDAHACDTRVADGHYDWEPVSPPAAACSVPSPDHSIADHVLRDLQAGATGVIEYTLSMTVEAKSVIEPASLALFAPPVLALAALRRRRAA